MNLFKHVDESWIPFLHSLAYEKPMQDFLKEISGKSFQPRFEEIFRVFKMPLKDIKCVIMGREPYPYPRAAVGLAHAVSEESLAPQVLQLIKEECGSSMPMKEWKTLSHWEGQGVFLLNASLTCETSVANSHQKHWESFIEKVVSYISAEKPCVWLLWGNYTNMFLKRIKGFLLVTGYDDKTIQEIPVDNRLNYVLPGYSPALELFQVYKNFSNKGFENTNVILKKLNINQINW